ncbi:MAG: hypothetical protein HY912_18145 [Desulfomonile tiedjei]|uniref:Uncharacterized protein n=1 Tax=Desulfomonile tiedjei TaxID=2358 RepID=A0A9D6Z1T0_9BACT|nr:hypothetical protein [Desulfomonile tiedjei]
MLKAFTVVMSTIVFSAAIAAPAFSYGENILAATGQYTFFIKPEPGSCTTYYQKMVPCVAKDIVPVPKRVSQTYPVPVPSIRNIPTVIHETPVGCACGAGPCVECFPRPSVRNASKEAILPRMVPVRVPGVEFVPREVTRRVMLPQWFAVTEEPLPPKQVRKIR